MRYTWAGGGIETLVTFTLAAVNDGTELTLVHSGFKGVKGWMISRMLGKGWRSRILRVYLPAALVA